MGDMDLVDSNEPMDITFKIRPRFIDDTICLIQIYTRTLQNTSAHVPT